MRPIIALLITISLMVFTYSYIKFSNSVRRDPTIIQVDYASGDFSIEVERTFECAGDPIFGSESLKVLFKGEKVFGLSENLPPDQPVLIEKIEGIEAGENEIFVSANMASTSDGLGAIKVTISRNGVPVTEQLLTSEPGLAAVSGPVSFTIPGGAEKEDEHVH